MRNIYLYGQITKEYIDEIVKKLIYLDSLKHEDINLYISSPGGDVVAAFTLIDVMNILTSNINTIALDLAGSAASLILANGHKRYAHKNSFVLIHEMKASSYSIDLVLNINKEIMKFLAKKTNKPIKVIEENCSFDNFLNAEEALSFNLIDYIV